MGTLNMSLSFWNNTQAIPILEHHSCLGTPTIPSWCYIKSFCSWNASIWFFWCNSNSRIQSSIPFYNEPNTRVIPFKILGFLSLNQPHPYPSPVGSYGLQGPSGLHIIIIAFYTVEISYYNWSTSTGGSLATS